MKFIKNLTMVALAAVASASELAKRDPYWIKMRDVINQVRPDFYFGVATQKNFFANPKYKDAVSTYNLQVAGNECKMYTIATAENSYNFNQCDASVEFSKKMNSKHRGHNLFWPANSPSWFKNWEHGNDVNMVKEYILDYVERVCEHYKDEEDIIYWDVINESVLDDSTKDNIKLRTGSDTETLFKGWDTYTEDIFKVASEHTNSNVKLCYNDYNAENNNGNINGKTGAVFNYIKQMKEKGVQIDCVGLQMHISCNYYPNYDQLTTLINMYAEIGVEVHVTEIDVSMKNCSTLEQQNKLYMDVFKACFENDNCKVFTVWGVYDTESWIGAENVPLIFDDDMYPKDIYFNMLDYIMKQLPSDATYPTPTSTIRPTESGSAKPSGDVVTIITPGEYMIDAQWSNWSWNAEVDFDGDGNLSAVCEADKYAALSLKFNSNFNGGVLHFELKTDMVQPVKVIVHSDAGDEFIEVGIVEKPTSSLKAYDITVPSIAGDTYSRISFQDAYGKGMTISINNVYFTKEGSISGGDEPEGEKYYLVKPGDYMIDAKFNNWSWGVADVEFNDDGELVAQTVAGTSAGLSFKRNDKVEFGEGDLYFKARFNDTSATLQILFHTTEDEYVGIGSFNKLSTETTQYNIHIKEPSGAKYDRITFQDMSPNGLTIYLTEAYFVPGTGKPVTTTTITSTTTTTTAQQATETTEPSKCWSEALGYKCCESSAVVYEDNDGKWGFENNDWCGIDDTVIEKCWSLALGYPCCEVGSVIYSIDENGSWGFENNNWCGINKKEEGCKFNELGYDCCPDNEVVVTDDHKWGVKDNEWCGVEF